MSSESNDPYYDKYLKYKAKYSALKRMADNSLYGGLYNGISKKTHKKKYNGLQSNKIQSNKLQSNNTHNKIN